MKNISFGKLLEKLLYISNQKKSTLAKELGYDVSYISKWINAKNLPTQKSISTICKITSQFIVKSLTSSAMEELIDYFEIDNDTTNMEVYLEKILRESYEYTSGRSLIGLYNNTRSEHSYNSIMHINPRVKKQYLINDFMKLTNKLNKLDLIVSGNLYKLNDDYKKSISGMKVLLNEVLKNTDVRVRFLMGFDGVNEENIYNTMIILNLLTTYPNINFKIYNYDLASNTMLTVIKDNMVHTALYTNKGKCLFTNMSKEKHVVDDMYYTLDEVVKTKATLVSSRKSPIDIIKDKTYIHYIMGQDLRLLIGSMNEFFMPHDLFMEVGKSIFGEDELILSELSQINIFLQNVTYLSKIKVLIYESELRRYISSGELEFFNVNIKLTMEQRERHIKYIKDMVKQSENIEIKLVDGDFIEDYKDAKDPSMYLSKTMKLVKSHPYNDINDYVVINDNDLKQICDDLFEVLWEKRDDIVINDKEDILERISKTLAYARILNGSYE